MGCTFMEIPTGSWAEWAGALAAIAFYKPVLNSSKHSVEAMEFVDPIGSSWRWSSQSGLISGS